MLTIRWHFLESFFALLTFLRLPLSCLKPLAKANSLNMLKQIPSSTKGEFIHKESNLWSFQGEKWDVSKRIYSYLSYITIFQYVERVGFLLVPPKKTNENLRISESYVYHLQNGWLQTHDRFKRSPTDLTFQSPPFGDQTHTLVARPCFHHSQLRPRLWSA